jgi:hypothetical protein
VRSAFAPRGAEWIEWDKVSAALDRIVNKELEIEQ